MPKNLSEFLTMMDERPWFRMLVCFLPVLVVAKLVGSAEGSFVTNVSTGVMLVGVALYLFWGRLRGLSTHSVEATSADDFLEGDDTAAVSSSIDASVSAQQQLALLAELRALCHEGESESDRLISLEVAVNKNLTYAEATQNALARRKLEAK